MRCSRTTENNNKQSDKKDQIDILTNNHDKKYNSTRHLKGPQFIYEDVYWEWSTSEYPKSRMKPCRYSLKFQATFAVFAIFQDKLWARTSRKAFFLQTIEKLNYLSERFLSSRGKKMSKDFFSSLLIY